MYLDGVSFVHKFNPFREAKTPIGRVWRRASEGLQCSTKGSKNLPGGRRAYVLVGIKFGVGYIGEDVQAYDWGIFRRICKK